LSVWTASPLVVGHRGGRGDGWPPENTIAAFERAHSVGARAVELDVRTCAGGEVVVFHDATLERMTGSSDRRRIAQVPLAELGRIDLGGGATVPALVDVLQWAALREVGVNVELKHDVPSRLGLVRATRTALRARRADVLLSSFDPLLLAMAATLAPSVPRALLTQSQGPVWTASLRGLVRPPWVSAVHLEAEQASGGVSGYRARGLRVGVWTVNDPQRALELFRQGVATVITDVPDLVLAAFSPSAS
jgi:glycerophosphoryl diester phosphodiesterase